MNTLPNEIWAPCCPGKSCGNTTLYLTKSFINDDVLDKRSGYVYRRRSNDEDYSPVLSEEDMTLWLKNRPALNEVYPPAE